MNRLFVYCTALLSFVVANGQVEMATDFRGEGKIYVVIAIILLILVGFFTLLIRLDTKTKKLEKEVHKDED